MSNENAVKNLIRIDDKKNPTLFRALQLLVDDLYKINNEVFPVVSPGEEQGSVGGIVLGPVQNFTGTAYPDNLRLDWDDLVGAFRYSIRLGLNWDTAKHVLITATDLANLDPLHLRLVYGNYNFIIRAMSIGGQLGEPASAVLIIPQIPPPDLSVEVVVSTVLLRWTEPVSAWRINHYIIYKDNVEIGTISGTFKLIQEQVGGTYSYSVAAVDIVGNISTVSAIKTVDLHDPSEFEFVDELSSDYSGTYVRTEKDVIDGITGILGPILIHTWQEHFVHYEFDSPFEQVQAGYPFYYQPTALDGYYQETFDFGEVQNDLKIVVDYNKLQLSGTTNITTELSYSEDGITWSPNIVSNTILADRVRYVAVLWRFTNVDDKAVAFISNLKVVLNITLIIDSGINDCLSSHAGGTEIFYNKDYTGISSVTATATTSMQPLYAVCDNITKDSFKCLVFDSSGNRVNASVSWKSRGIV